MKGWSDEAWAVVLAVQDVPVEPLSGLAFAARTLRALAGAWAEDGEYTADDLRAVAKELDPGGAA